MRDSEELDMDEQATTTPSPVPPTPGAPAAAATATTSAADARSATPRPQPARILGRNVNGTVVQTSMPQNEAELQLYRVMQRASLLSYYDTLLEMGGDDVQQLCDAGEEEFLEIMALVGMASKPLHVRRLQKALQEWLTNPGMFQTPVLAPPSSSSSCSSGSTSAGKKPATPTAAPAISGAFPGIAGTTGSYSPKQPEQQPPQQAVLQMTSSTGISALSSINSLQTAKLAAAAAAAASSVVQQQASPSTPPGCTSSTLVAQSGHLVGQFSAVSAGCCPVQRRKSLSPLPFVTGMPMHSQQQTAAAAVAEPAGASSALPSSLPLSRSPGIIQSVNYESSSCGSQGTTPSPGSNCTINAPQSPTTGGISQMSTPILLESQVQRLAQLAEKIAAKYRPVNPKPPSGIKKKISKNLETVMAMPESDPRKMEEIRKYAAIYGRFDCKRKPEKPLTLHEVSVNEAAAQICRFAPILLTRRDELFPLARQVVRDSGHYFTKNLMHSSSMTSPRRMSSSRENGDGDLSGGDDSSIMSGDLAKKRKLDLRCTSEDDSVTGNGDNSSEQAESARLRCINFGRSGSLGIDSDGISIQVHRNRHRKRQRRRRPLKIVRKSTSSPIWQSCSDGGSNMIIDGVVEGLEDSDGCYSSYEEEWDNCNDDGCEDNFGIDSDEPDDNDDESALTATPLINDSQIPSNLEEDDTTCIMDKENDFNLKVIASCGDNIIAVANPALMNRNQPSAITKEQTIKEEIALRDRRD